MKALPALFYTVLLYAAPAAAAESTRLAPVDEAAADTTWVRFKSHLLSTLEKQDVKTLLGLLDPRVRNISGTSGAAEFRKLWEPQSPGSPLWNEMRSLLFLGGAYVKREKSAPEFCAPYVYYKWPEDAPLSADAVITASGVLLKAEPSSAAATQATLSYDLVSALDWEVADTSKDSRQKWVKIQAGRDSGYVPEEQIRSPLEYRACFAKTPAGWKITSFDVGE